MQSGIWRSTSSGRYIQVLGVGSYEDGERRGETCVIYLALNYPPEHGPLLQVISMREWENPTTVSGEYAPHFEYVGDAIPLPKPSKTGKKPDISDAAASFGSQMSFDRRKK